MFIFTEENQIPLPPKNKKRINTTINYSLEYFLDK